MEALEANGMESAILWRVQTILEALHPGELDAWLHGVGLAGGIGELKSEVERMETVVNGVKGRAVGNKPLVRSLSRAKELMYEADDVVDELDYCRLQHQVLGVMLAPANEQECMVGDRAQQVDASDNPVVMLAPAIESESVVRDGAEHVDASGSTSGIPDNNGRKNRSKERDYFHITPAVDGEPARAKCIDCGTQVVFNHGTSVLRKHRNSASCKKKRAAIEEAPNCPSAGDSVQNGPMISTNGSEGRKRMRTEGNVATTTPPWDKAKFSERIHKLALELGSIRGYVIEYLKDSVASSSQYESNTISDTIVRTSGSLPGRVYGRYEEKEYIMGIIKDAESDTITVLPIAGIVGVGKTALAKLVYNNQLVKKQFVRIWVWVSSIFDEVRVAREILDVITLDNNGGLSPRVRESYEGVINYTKLQEVLKNHMACWPKKFLLVLDDVNDSMGNSQWKDLLDALGSSCTKGNVIIVTARNFSIAQRLATAKPVKLGPLRNEDFWLLFKACAFGDNNYRVNLDIGRQIATMLNGNPLAAESAADMLREHPTNDRWESIMKKGVWESLQFRGGILSALKVSYYQLPYHLQQCFLVCSIFPNNHQFHIDSLVYMWMSLGFVKSIETGQDYLNALVNSGFLEKVKTQEYTLGNKNKKSFYVVCGLMHEFARLVSRTEFAIIDGFECKEVLPTVRHLSILTDSVYHIDEHGIIPRNLKFEEKLKSLVSSVKRLRTLILIGHYDHLFFLSFHTFICNLVNSTHLRYLQLENKGSSEDLPTFLKNYFNLENGRSRESLAISLNKLYHLGGLDVGRLAIVHGINDLVSMRHLVLTNGPCDALTPAWHACLQTIQLEDCEGWQTLPFLESLSFLMKLKLRNVMRVTELLIPLLKELVLIDMPKLDRCFPNSVRELNSSLRVLEIRRCRLLKAFPLFESCEKNEIEQKSWLPNVSELTIHECPNLVISNPLPPSSSFCKLSITHVSALPTMVGSSNGEFKFKVGSSIDFLDDRILSFRNLRNITRLEITQLSISLEGLRQLVCLKRLELWNCATILSSNVLSVHTQEEMSPATDFDASLTLECLIISYCGITGQGLSAMLQHVRALEELHLNSCEHITWLLIEGKENSLSNATLAPYASSVQKHPDATSMRSCPDKLLCVPSNLIPSLKKICIEFCGLKFLGNKEGFSGFTSLEELRIFNCPELIPSLVHEDEINDQANERWPLPCSLDVLNIRSSPLRTLRPYFPGDLTCLTVLKVWGTSESKSLQLHSCTALEKLSIGYCESLDAVEGVQSLRSLRYLDVSNIPRLKSLPLHACTKLEELTIGDCQSLDALEGVESLLNLRYLDVYRCPSLPQCLENLSTQSYELFPRLESLQINDYCFLTVSFCKQLTSLQCLKFNRESVAVGLTNEQEAALELLTSLQQLRFDYCSELSDLPVGLRSLPSLKRLEIINCPRILMLPQRDLPPSLEELEVFCCSEELTEQCRMLATSKIKVIIDVENM